MKATDILDLLPVEFANRLTCDPFFADIPVVVAEKGNLARELEKLQAVITGKTGKRGVAVIVLQMVADDLSNNLTFGPMKLKPAFQVVENVELNNDESGTGKSARKVGRRIRDVMKNANLIGLVRDMRTGQPCIEPVDLTEIAANLVGYQVNFECLEVSLEQLTQVELPVLAGTTVNNEPAFALTCPTAGAEIWFTTDDTFPFNGTADQYPGSTAQRYTGAVPFTDSVLVRACAFLAGETNIASGIIRSTVTAQPN
jgi:hypothetical protein